jgi:hypothetical protein
VCTTRYFTLSARLFSCAATLLLIFLAACGGGSFGPGLDTTGDWLGHSWDSGVRSGSYVVVAVDSADKVLPELTDKLALDVEPGQNGDLVRIRTRGLADCNYVGLHLGYDGLQRRPRTSQCGRGLEDKTLFLGVTDRPGAVAIGITTIGGAPTLSGDMTLAEVQFEHGPYMGMHHASLLCKTPVADLALDDVTLGLLHWTYNAPGDANQDSLVNTADVVPLGVHFGKDSTAGDWATAQVADTNRSGNVNIADLTPIGIHFQERVTGYQVLDCDTEAGQYNPVAGALAQFSVGVIPGGGGFKQFSYNIAAPAEGMWYAVIAMEDTDMAAAHSNAVQYSAGGLLPPQNLRGSSDGTHIQLFWDAPASGTPDGYNVFLSSASDMAGATQANLAPVTGTSYSVPAIFTPENSYYCAVVAMYGAIPSDYSNIYHYIPGGDAPQNLTAQRATDHIQLDWEAPTGGAPDGYNAYIGVDNAMTDAVRLNGATLIPGLTYDVSTMFSPDGVHYFGVKGSSGGVEGEYSNIFKYDPGAGPDIEPPVWQGDPGVKSVAPEDTQVTVTWSAAVDAKTPPVQYLLYYVEDGVDFDWNSPAEVYASTVTSAPVIGLVNGTKYKFAVRAQDSAAPPNMTTNENFLYGTPMIFPDDGAVGAMLASDVASVRMPGEELPRIAAVNHSAELWYSFFNGTGWTSVDLNTIIADPARKYHPQMLGIGTDVHIVYGTPGGVFEIYGPKDADPSTWTQKAIVASGLSNVYGIGFAYSEADSYLAVVYATKTGTEQLYYSDRDVTGDWNTPVSIMDGNPQIWQCDMAINQFDGSQWVVAANGKANSTGDDLKFHYAHRDDRAGTWTGGASGYGGDVMVVEIDPTIHQPVVVNAEVREVSVPLAGNQPVSDATVYTWDGTTWLKNVLEQGDCIYDESVFSLDTILTGQDPQLVFSPTGKAVAIWTKLDFLVDLLESTADLTGDWRYGQRTDTIWGSTKSMIAHITSSNSVTAGEGYQHCVTCDLGLIDSGDYTTIAEKYSTRNDYVEGELLYHRQTW